MKSILKSVAIIGLSVVGVSPTAASPMGDVLDLRKPNIEKSKSSTIEVSHLAAHTETAHWPISCSHSTTHGADPFAIEAGIIYLAARYSSVVRQGPPRFLTCINGSGIFVGQTTRYNGTLTYGAVAALAQVVSTECLKGHPAVSGLIGNEEDGAEVSVGYC